MEIVKEQTKRKSKVYQFVYKVEGHDPVIFLEDETRKAARSSWYNYNFDKRTGYFVRWGKDMEDNPIYGPCPEILDIEVTTICKGVPGMPVSQKQPDGSIIMVEAKPIVCKFCYKGNTPNGKNMTLETFKRVLMSFPHKVHSDGTIQHALNQFALGSDSDLSANPELFDMMDYARSIGIIPNITVSNIGDEVADKLVARVGAVAVSRYENKNYCYDSVKRLTDRGLNQCNIHMMVSKENYERCLETIEDRLTDPRLAKLNAIVFLSLKQKKRGVNHEIIDFPLYKKVIDLAMEKGVGFGADSCSAPKLMKAIEDHKDFKTIQNVIEPCEILKFSSYINHKGEYSPCSFLDGVDGWDKPIDMTKVVNFEKEVWFSEKCKAYRQKRIDLENQGIACTYYEV